MLTVLDEVLLRRWTGMPAARVDRLRYKPSTSLRAAVDPGDGGPWWLVTAHSAASWRKVGKDARAARGAAVLDEGLRLVRVPALTDRALPDLAAAARGARTVAHNPARRAVLRHGASGECRKVHADAGTAVRSVHAARALSAAGIATPPAEPLGRHGVRTPWLPGRAATAADRTAVSALVRGWARTDAGRLPVLDRAGLQRGRGPGRPGDRRPRHRLRGPAAAHAHRWAAAAEADAADLDPVVFAHGDLSPDQLLHTAHGWVVLDVDRACRAPAGWDLASWDAAVVAQDADPGEPGEEVPGVLRAAAALLRARNRSGAGGRAGPAPRAVSSTSPRGR